MAMKQINVAKATGPALDWLVAKCEGCSEKRLTNTAMWLHTRQQGAFRFSTYWSEGGPIIEREMLCVGYKHQADPNYCPINDTATSCWARTTAGGYMSYGPNPLIAAMRCYVASKLGDEAEVPEELADAA